MIKTVNSANIVPRADEALFPGNFANACKCREGRSQWRQHIWRACSQQSVIFPAKAPFKAWIQPQILAMAQKLVIKQRWGQRKLRAKIFAATAKEPG